MSRRIRLEGPTLKNWDEVNALLGEQGLIDLSLQEIEGNLNLEINGLKEKAKAQAKSLEERSKVIAREVKEFCDHYREEIKGKEKVLTFGKVGYRKSTKISIPTKAKSKEAIIDALRKRKLLQCIRITEEISKDAIRALPDDVIIAIGCKKKVEDIFFLEPDHEKLKA